MKPNAPRGGRSRARRVHGRAPSAIRWWIAAVLVLAACRPDQREKGRPTGDEPSTRAARSAPSDTPSEEAIVRTRRAVRLLEQFRYADAATELEAAVATAPGWLPARVDLAIAHVNRLEPEHGPRAVAEARRAVELAPGDPRATYVLAYALAERERAFGEALPLLRRVVADVPGDGFAWYQLGRCAEAVRQESGAEELGAEAERAFRRALEIDPELVEANYRLGRLLLESDETGRQDEGMAILERHQELMRGRPSVQQNYLTRGELAQAYPLELGPPPPPAPRPVTLRASPALAVPPFPSELAVPGVSASRYSDGLTVADLNGDGHLDVLAPRRQPGQPVLLAWLAAGDGSFAHPLAYGPQGLACGSAPVGDLNGDGTLDVFVTCNAGNVLLLNRAGALVPASDDAGVGIDYRAGLAATLVDVDHDGDLDVHVIGALAGEAGGPGWSAEQWLLRQTEPGRFVDATRDLGLGVALENLDGAWTDLDGDNAVDLVAFVAGEGLTVFLNAREGPFRAVPLSGEPPPVRDDPMVPRERRLAILDVDGDADSDVAIVEADRLQLLVNESTPGGLALTPARPLTLPGPAGSVAVADLDLDGHRELVALGGGPADGEERRAEATVHDVEAGGRRTRLVVRWVPADGLERTRLVAADLDADGDADLVVKDRAGAPLVLWNETGAGEGVTWVAVSAAGRQGRSNAQGYGAKLTLDAGRLRQHVEVRASSGPLCHAAAPTVFGLGGRPGFEGVSVLWPSGIRQAELDLAPGEVHVVMELDRQPSSCPMLYGWDGESFRFLTDCFDTAPLGLWIGPGTHWAGDPEEYYRLRPGAVRVTDGVVSLAVAEFLNESLLADRIALLAVDRPAERTLVVDEAVRLASPPPAFVAWSLGRPEGLARAELDGHDVTRTLRTEDRDVAGYSTVLPWIGFAEPHALTMQVEDADGVLVLTGSLNFSNSLNLFAASQAGVAPMPPRLEVLVGGEWQELSPDIGLPAGFHKDVVVDLRAVLPRGPATLRVTTNLQVSWDRATVYRDASRLSAGASRQVPTLRAEKRWLGVPREVRGPENRWREFPREGLAGAADWVSQGGPRTADGDVRDLLREVDGELVFVRPGEEIVLGFDVGALPPVASGSEREWVLATHGWVKDADPHTAHSSSLLPLPRPGEATYP